MCIPFSFLQGTEVILYTLQSKYFQDVFLLNKFIFLDPVENLKGSTMMNREAKHTHNHALLRYQDNNSIVQDFVAHRLYYLPTVLQLVQSPWGRLKN